MSDLFIDNDLIESGSVRPIVPLSIMQEQIEAEYNFILTTATPRTWRTPEQHAAYMAGQFAAKKGWINYIPLSFIPKEDEDNIGPMFRAYCEGQCDYIEDCHDAHCGW